MALQPEVLTTVLCDLCRPGLKESKVHRLGHVDMILVLLGQVNLQSE